VAAKLIAATAIAATVSEAKRFMSSILCSVGGTIVIETSVAATGNLVQVT
jgi:hypothetical protein